MSGQPHSSTTRDEALVENQALQGYLLGRRVNGQFTATGTDLPGMLATLYQEAKTAAETAVETPDNLHLRQVALLKLARWRDARYSLLGRKRLLAHGARSRSREIYEVAAADILAQP